VTYVNERSRAITKSKHFLKNFVSYVASVYSWYVRRENSYNFNWYFLFNCYRYFLYITQIKQHHKLVITQQNYKSNIQTNKQTKTKNKKQKTKNKKQKNKKQKNKKTKNKRKKTNKQTNKPGHCEVSFWNGPNKSTFALRRSRGRDKNRALRIQMNGIHPKLRHKHKRRQGY